jgi:predicted alpha/beta superfamily hydrolase
MRKLTAFLLSLFCSTLLFGQVKVTFKTANYPAFKTDAKNIFLAGNFNGWNPLNPQWQLRPDATGNYQLTIAIPSGKYSFKATKGSWQTVECGPNGGDIDNRDINIVHDTTIVITIAGWKDDFPSQVKKHTASANVDVISENFDIPQLGRQRRVWIYLPPDYGRSHKKYPVIYMHDGQNLFDAYTSGYGEWGIDEIMDKLPDASESIIVGIDHGGEYRITEYDPYDSKYGKGRGADYVDFLVKTLKPYIDTHYRTKKDAKHTTVAGSSMGGLISMYAVLKYPKVFGNGGIFSPAFWIALQIYDFAQQQPVPRSTRFYFVCGDSEGDSMVADMQKMADIIRAKGISEKNTPTVIMPGEKHNEQQWNKDFPAFYSWLIKGY